MPEKSYICGYARLLLFCGLFSALGPALSFGLAPRLETTQEISRADDGELISECPDELVGFLEEWTRAVAFAREMRVRKGDTVLVVGGSPMLLGLYLAVNRIDCTLVDMDPVFIDTTRRLLDFYAKQSGNLEAIACLHTHVLLFQAFSTDREFDHVTLFDIFFLLQGGRPEKMIENAVRYTKDGGTMWLCRNYTPDFGRGRTDTAKILARTPFGAFVSMDLSHKPLYNPNYPAGYYDDSLNTAYTVHKDDLYGLLMCA